MEINSQTGEALSVRPLVQPSSSGFYPWWPTTFEWSPDGTRLACVRADSVGLVDLGTGECRALITFPLFETRGAWSWRSTVSFSPDGSLLLTTVHGQPIGSEPPGTSPAFHVSATDVAGTFSANIVENAGIWSMPRYSPAVTDPVTGEQRGFIAYMRARDLSNSINDSAQYDLVIADRDGSNAEVIFPPSGQAGLTANADFTWSPDGAQIAFIYQGNLWAIDVASKVAHQLTLDGGASTLVWTR
jgi:Tol biopolymer transport system component